ncbi:metal-sulfur cluster assembly factor [Compostibacter hankyongensis]|uniref:SUF system Fe-S cluster assembly protein n=1 Tax=Compostibacter hankyongensis TaxID=1007089 RepID=A0ABP8FD27_9BACT
MKVDIHDPFFSQKMTALHALHGVMDPELFINIIDLGLVYDISFLEEEKIIIIMTLSTPHCPLGEAIRSGVGNVLRPLFPEREAEIRIVWEPAWSPAMITEAGKQELGI